MIVKIYSNVSSFYQSLLQWLNCLTSIQTGFHNHEKDGPVKSFYRRSIQPAITSSLALLVRSLAILFTSKLKVLIHIIKVCTVCNIRIKMKRLYNKSCNYNFTWPQHFSGIIRILDLNFWSAIKNFLCSQLVNYFNDTVTP